MMPPDPQPPDPARVPPVWDAPPAEAPPRPERVCLRGHRAARWDAATGRWRCASCWELYRE